MGGGVRISGGVWGNFQDLPESPTMHGGCSEGPDREGTIKDVLGTGILNKYHRYACT